MLVRERAALTLDQDSAVLGWKGVSHLAPMLCYAAPGLTTLIGYLNHLVFASVPDCTRSCWQKSHSNKLNTCFYSEPSGVAQFEPKQVASFGPK